MISLSTIDQLTVAIATDGQLRGEFMANRLGAIEAYNRGYARRFGESPILLSDDERHLVASVSAGSIQQFYEVMAVVLDQIEAAEFSLNSALLNEMLPNRPGVEPRRAELLPKADHFSAA
jgi:hypothetical protein